MLTSEIKRAEPVAKNTRYMSVSKTLEFFGFYILFQIVEEIVNPKDFPRLIHWVEILKDEHKKVGHSLSQSIGHAPTSCIGC